MLVFPNPCLELILWDSYIVSNTSMPIKISNEWSVMYMMQSHFFMILLIVIVVKIRFHLEFFFSHYFPDFIAKILLYSIKIVREVYTWYASNYKFFSNLGSVGSSSSCMSFASSLQLFTKNF